MSTASPTSRAASGRELRLAVEDRPGSAAAGSLPAALVDPNGARVVSRADVEQVARAERAQRGLEVAPGTRLRAVAVLRPRRDEDRAVGLGASWMTNGVTAGNGFPPSSTACGRGVHAQRRRRASGPGSAPDSAPTTRAVRARTTPGQTGFTGMRELGAGSYHATPARRRARPRRTPRPIRRSAIRYRDGGNSNVAYRVAPRADWLRRRRPRVRFVRRGLRRDSGAADADLSGVRASTSRCTTA